MKSLRLVAVTLLVAWPSFARASAFTVDPLQVQLSAKRASQVVTLTNGSATELRFEVKIFKWGHGDAGEMELDPTNDIVVFPTLLTLKPGEKKSLRAGTSMQAGT